MQPILSFSRLILFTGTSLLLLNAASAERVEHLGCYAEWSEDTLTLGNELVQRQWQIEASGLLRPVSFVDKVGDAEWLRRPSRQPAPFPAVPPVKEARELEFRIVKEKLSPVEADSLILYVTAVGEVESFYYRFQVFPGTAGISMHFSSNQAGAVASAEVAEEDAGQPTGLENSPQAAKRQSKFASALDDLMLAPSHLRYTQVEFKDQTDYHDELVFEREWLTRLERFDVQCNVFHIEDNLTKNGLIFLKLAPLPHARPVPSPYDVKVFAAGRRVAFAGHGYPWTIIPYQEGRAGRIAAMQRYQRALRAYDPEREAIFSGDIIPIGERPDGVVWTGLASLAKDRQSARLVVFRELNEAAEWTTEIPLLANDDAEATILGGDGEAEFEDGELQVEVGEPLGYLFLKVE